MKKRIVSLLIVCVLLLLSGCGSILPVEEAPSKTQETTVPETAAPQGPVTVEGPGFDSPEEAILAYAGALQAGDVQQILSTFAIETYVENFDLTGCIENTGAYSVSMQQPIPSSDAYTTELNQVIWQYNIVRNLTYMYITLSGVENFTAPITFNGNPYEQPSELVDDLMIYNWMGILADMKIGKVLRFEDLFENSEQMEKALENHKRYLNCEELIPLAVELTLDGERYYLCVDVARYDGRWYNCRSFGTIAMYLSADALGGGLYPLED